MMFFAQLKRHLLPPVLFMIGAGLATTGYVKGQQYRDLRERGRTVEAQVDRVTWKEQVSGREQAFKVDVSFVTEDRRTIRAAVLVPKADAGRVGDDGDGKVTVVYLPSSPDTVRLASAPDESAVMRWAGLGLMAVGAFVFAWRRRAARATP
jgi:hypothetical protein